MRSLVILAVLLATCHASLAQEFPSERPYNCNKEACSNCTPFLPPRGKPNEFPCGADDFYFPVPVVVVRNDTSVNQEINAVQWVCYACCAVGCGYDDLGSACAYRAYSFSFTKENTYGCTKCAKGDVRVDNGGDNKLSFEDLSTKLVYSVINQPFSSKCRASDFEQL